MSCILHDVLYSEYVSITRSGRAGGPVPTGVLGSLLGSYRQFLGVRVGGDRLKLVELDVLVAFMMVVGLASTG